MAPPVKGSVGPMGAFGDCSMFAGGRECRARDESQRSKEAHGTTMKREAFHDGRQDGLAPLESLDLGKVKTFADLLRAMARTAFSGRQLGEAFEVVLDMVRNPDCRVVLTVSGAMTVAKQGRIICDMIDLGLVDAVVATGALIAHGLTESIGLTHYRHDGTVPDSALFERGYNRVYDTLEMESNLNSVEVLVRHVLNEETPPDGVWSSARICRAVGGRLSELGQGPGILRSAYERGIPVFIPAMTDSEMGLDFATWAMSQALASSPPLGTRPDPQEVFRAVPQFNPFLDLQEYARWAGSAAAWASSRWVAECRATGRSRLLPTTTLPAIAWASISPHPDFAMACGFVPSRSTGADSRAVRTPRG